MQTHRPMSPTRGGWSWAVARDVSGGSRGRRKEVALGRLITVSLILILGAWGGASEGASPDDAAAAPSTAIRKPPPVPPIKYLEAGARLFNSAQTTEQIELASKYLEASNSYRDQLQPDEQQSLDEYLNELAKAKTVLGSSPAAAGQPRLPADERRPAAPAATAAVSKPTRENQLLPSTDVKQRGRWLLHEAREQLIHGNYEQAQRSKVAPRPRRWRSSGHFSMIHRPRSRRISRKRGPREPPRPRVMRQHSLTIAGRPVSSSKRPGRHWTTANSSRRRQLRWRSRNGN